MPKGRQVTETEWTDAETIWEYHQLHHTLAPCDAAIALGCNDIGVAEYAADLYHRGMFPVVVFSGATSRDTAAVFPRGEAVHYRERALELGVSDDAILVEPEAANTGENITRSRDLLDARGVAVDRLLLVCMPYMERRAYATTRQVWSEIKPICASAPLSLDAYVKTMGDAAEVIDMMMGDFQRVLEYPKLGFAIPQEAPEEALAAFDRLRHAGYTSRLLA